MLYLMYVLASRPFAVSHTTCLHLVDCPAHQWLVWATARALVCGVRALPLLLSVHVRDNNTTQTERQRADFLCVRVQRRLDERMNLFVYIEIFLFFVAVTPLFGPPKVRAVARAILRSHATTPLPCLVGVPRRALVG